VLDLFPDPDPAPRFTVVFRVKRQGPTLPKVGSTSSVRPGDTLTFFDEDNRFTTRTVQALTVEGAVAAPLLGSDGRVLHGPQPVPFDRFYEAVRRLGGPIR